MDVILSVTKELLKEIKKEEHIYFTDMGVRRKQNEIFIHVSIQ